ncbi:MAG TPA: redoxin domain-containing protein [Pirellulales bacterium]|nr:redoxin domain-containing protein [Pirellulales bacterium]
MSALALLVLSCCVAADTPEATAPIGKQVDNFKLQDYLGAWHELDELKAKKAVVVAFLGTECPLCLQYGPQFAKLAKEYEPQGVAFIGIDANQQDSLQEMAHYARSYGVDFTLLKDPGNKIADQFAAIRTPEVFVLDGQRAVRYWGPIDDQFGVGYVRPKAEHRFLAEAIDAVLAGKAVPTPVMHGPGCYIGRVNRKPATGDITYTKHIAPLLNAHCVRCHRKGEIGPFTLTSYDDVVGWTETIREVITQRRMPPWHASPEFGHFRNDARLPDEAKELIFKWIDNGVPAGDPADLPAPPEFVEGWRIGKPDLVFSMPQAFTVPAKGVVPYQTFVVDVTLDEDKWIQAAEVRPGNRAVVHHLVLYYVPPGADKERPEAVLFNSLAAYSPGMPASVFREGHAKFVPKGSKLKIQCHYTPNGSEQVDQSVAGLIFARPDTVKKQLLTQLCINFKLHIPPGEANYVADAEHRFDQETRLYSLLPHMHLRGKSFRFDARYPDGTSETLLDVPRYDFNWQNSYVFAEPKRMPEGTVIHCTASFDNSAENPTNPDPTSAVRWGEQTWEEMLVGTFETTRADQDLSLGLPAAKRLAGGDYEVTFHYRPDVEAREVYLAGEFNEWKPTGHKMDGPDAEGNYTTMLTLKPGKHEYKYVVDGATWRADPGNPEQAGFYHNSVLTLAE